MPGSRRRVGLVITRPSADGLRNRLSEESRAEDRIVQGSVWAERAEARPDVMTFNDLGGRGQRIGAEAVFTIRREGRYGAAVAACAGIVGSGDVVVLYDGEGRRWRCVGVDDGDDRRFLRLHCEAVTTAPEGAGPRYTSGRGVAS